MTHEAWQSDWNDFVTLFQQKLRMGETASALSQFFSEKVVIWNGILDDKSIDDLAPNVGITLPEREIDLGDGSLDTLDGISLPINDCAVSDWQRLEIGCPVQFSAKFSSAEFIFQPIEIKHLTDGTRLLFIRLTDGKVVL